MPVCSGVFFSMNLCLMPGARIDFPKSRLPYYGPSPVPVLMFAIFPPTDETAFETNRLAVPAVAVVSDRRAIRFLANTSSKLKRQRHPSTPPWVWAMPVSQGWLGPDSLALPRLAGFSTA